MEDLKRLHAFNRKSQFSPLWAKGMRNLVSRKPETFVVVVVSLCFQSCPGLKAKQSLTEVKKELQGWELV